MSDKEDLRKKISPKAISALIMEDANRIDAPKFIKKAYNLVFVNPDKLTEDWVKRINQWAKNTVKSMSIDSEFKTPVKGDYLVDLGPLTIKKKISRHSKSAYNERFFDYIAVNEDGWKYWFRLYFTNTDLKSGKSKFPKRNQKIIIKKARVRDNRTGITFLAMVRNFLILEE